MRITEHTNTDSRLISKSVTNSASIVEKQGHETIEKMTASNVEQMADNTDETKAKVQEAVRKMNEMLEVNQSTSKFMYHEGLERYYVTVVNRDTEEVVKEIPPKKLLDAFYEMQKMLGMIVDEKI
jgi:flagellar protein FlaG